ncbi:hypothetical protein JQ621_03090 [Bradyrhizobium manausense]|uniref:hypothetical protein n=1 Tax=Bradyrhizobium manausense TaxID=989370 RepID=UPI001BA5BC94|nr:hypothetical protein [Bradyrhizobium manausense]MBR1086453.1 hypothetical protein [Bradyrhizobium manausense]
MIVLRRILFAAALLVSAIPAFAQAPSPVPALPDSERRTSYTISGTTCACNVNFALYGDSTDYQNWVEVFLNGVQVSYNDSTFGWTLTSPSGSLANLARPITDAIITFTNAQTGTVQIVGARRPRRTAQFTENRGVAARDFNQALTDIIAQNRETWDKISDVTGRSIVAVPGETLSVLPPAGTRASQLLGFDSGGNVALYSAQLPAINQTANTFYAGPATGSPAAASFRALVGADLPAPGASSFGGVRSSTCSTSNWFSSLSTGGVFGCTQPNFSDLLGTASTAQIAASAVTNAKLANMNAYTLKGNATGSAATPTDIDVTALTLKASPVSGDIVLIQDSAASNAFKKTTVGALSSAGSVASIDSATGAFTTANGITSAGNVIALTAARRTLPTTQVFTTGSGTYTTPANVLWIEVKMCGGGAGGSGSGSTGATFGTSGGDSTFSTFTASKGSAPGSQTSAGAGGTATGGYLNQTGGSGGAGSGSTSPNPGGGGGVSAFGGAGASGVAGAGTGGSAATNSCSGGGGGGVNTTANGGAGGGAGGYLEGIIGSPSASYSYSVGAAGSGGSAGTGGSPGGGGGAGRIVVIEHYGT